MKTRRLKQPWPFPISVTEKGMVRNIQPPQKPRPERPPVKFNPNQAQEALL